MADHETDQDAMAQIVDKIDEILHDDAISASLRVRLLRWRHSLADGWGLPPLRLRSVPVARIGREAD